MATSSALREIFAAGRPLIEQWLDVAEQIAALRDVAAEKGLDWSQLKALMKAQIQDERDEAGDGKRVRRIVEKAEFASAYADMLGLANMNENNFSDEIHPSDRGGNNPDLNPSAAHGAGASAAHIQGSVGRDYSAGSNATASLASDESEAPHSHSSASSSLTQTDQADAAQSSLAASATPTDESYVPAFLRRQEA